MLKEAGTLFWAWAAIAVLSLSIGACGGGGGGGGPAPPLAVVFCDTRAFTPAAQSPYVLPYPPGVTYMMFQGNCSPVTFTANNFPDDGNAANAGGNSAWVLHDDGTIAAYFHMCQGCVMVSVNQDVVAGEILGLAGNSGASAGPHLHFQVFEDNTSFNNDDAMPITFSNATGNMAATGELLEGQAYTAN
jgi:hypothetical protein